MHGRRIGIAGFGAFVLAPACPHSPLFSQHLNTLCAGQHLLVATAAAEEGLNIPATQFVIRFNAPQTGEAAVAAASY